MVTRFRVRTNRPTQCLNLHVSSIAFNDPNSQNAMFDEYNALIKNNTWTLVPRPTDINIVRCMWLFHHKYLVDDILSCYKARLVVNGSTHIEGIDVDESFSPVVKLGTIQTVLSLATSRHWPVYQLDVKNAFLHSDLAETVYMHQPLGFWNSAHLDYVCLFRTPVDTESKLGDDGDPVSDPKLYMSLVGSLQYITFTSQYISYVVQHVYLYMHDPREPHFSALKRILSRYKARLVANGSTQLEGIDVDDTFSLVVKPDTIRTVLSLATSRYWPVHQLDVNNAFLYEVSLWAQAGLSGLGTDIVYLLLYVDDIVITSSSKTLLQKIIVSLHHKFSMTDLGSLNYNLSIFVTHDSSGMFLSQCKYVAEILKRTHMANCNPSHTPVDTESKLGDDGDPIFDPTLYRSLAGTLQYFTFTRPNISYTVQQVCLYMHDPWEPYFLDLKRILRYVRGTLDYGLQLFSSSNTSLVAYLYADWAGCPTTRRSTSGYCVFLGNNLLSWSSKRQPTLSHSGTKAEYRGVANVVAETCWLRNLLRELHTPLSSATLVYCYNVNVVYLSSNLVQVLHVPSCYQYADIFTKGLPSTLFEEFRTSLSLQFPPTQTTGVESSVSWRGITSSCLQPWRFDTSLSDTHLNTKHLSREGNGMVNIFGKEDAKLDRCAAMADYHFQNVCLLSEPIDLSYYNMESNTMGDMNHDKNLVNSKAFCAWVIMTVFEHNNLFYENLKHDSTERNSLARDKVNGILFSVSVESNALATSMFFWEILGNEVTWKSTAVKLSDINDLTDAIGGVLRGLLFKENWAVFCHHSTSLLV
ncbi:ribonuclease H-like domain-containing protein [Tanacetum coccineum]